MKEEPLRVAVLTVSDSASRGAARDLGGPALAGRVARLGWALKARALCPDDVGAIAARLRSWCDSGELDLVLTTGGTGLGPRDVTPEATRPLLDKEIPGLAERMRRESERRAPAAALSRAVCGSRRGVLIVNLPGNPRGACECLGFVAALLPHARRMLRGEGHPRRDARRSPPSGSKAPSRKRRDAAGK